MSDIKLLNSMDNLGNALSRLEDTLRRPLNDDTRDIAILRFTFVYELSWKTQRRFLLYEKFPQGELTSPREVLRKSYQTNWLKDDQLWLDMADDRNDLVHTYNENLANAVYERIKGKYAIEFRRVFDFLQEKFSDILDDPKT